VGHVALPADVADTASLLKLRDAVRARYGDALHILVNAAGFTKSVPHADLDALDDALIDRMFAVNWRGQFAAIRTFAPMLKASGDGLIVSISSIAGQTGSGSSIAYCATKAGIDVMTKSLARALAPEVRVLGVAPGVVDTGFVPGRGPEFNAKTAASTPLRRVARPEDVAEALLACATSLGFSTGTTIVVDGGRSL
jgi:3-oxoacyl-[acyl-carrier protein] reductase